ncbi:hypothetical protein [Saccharopolyspora shandongensis]|uniref:hypothetical protein n=1 Tax=Saccharopolyspora shandongensis TaxID=418495 RepID=UPI0033E9416A
MAVFTSYLLRRMEPLPPDTDPARMRAAQRLVRKGVLGSDPATNALAAQLAEQVQAVPQWKKTTTVAFLGFTALSAYLMVQEIGDGDVGQAVFYGAGALFFLLALTVVQPRADRLYRNAAKLRQAVAHSNDARSGDETPMDKDLVLGVLSIVVSLGGAVLGALLWAGWPRLPAVRKTGGSPSLLVKLRLQGQAGVIISVGMAITGFLRWPLSPEKIGLWWNLAGMLGGFVIMAIGWVKLARSS